MQSQKLREQGDYLAEISSYYFNLQNQHKRNKLLGKTTEKQTRHNQLIIYDQPSKSKKTQDIRVKPKEDFEPIQCKSYPIIFPVLLKQSVIAQYLMDYEFTLRTFQEEFNNIQKILKQQNFEEPKSENEEVYVEFYSDDFVEEDSQVCIKSPTKKKKKNELAPSQDEPTQPNIQINFEQKKVIEKPNQIVHFDENLRYHVGVEFQNKVKKMGINLNGKKGILEKHGKYLTMIL